MPPPPRTSILAGFLVKIKVAEIPLWYQRRCALNHHPLTFFLIWILLGLSFYVGLEISTVVLFSIYIWSLRNMTLDPHLIYFNDVLK